MDTKKQSDLTDRLWLADMLRDSYLPKQLVAKGQKLLAKLAAQIAEERPKSTAVYKLTHATTEAFNELAKEFEEAGSEIETAAREAIAADIGFILEHFAYDVDLEEAIAPRDW